MFFKLRSFKKNLVILIENNIRIKKNSGYKTSKLTKKIVFEIIFLNYFKKINYINKTNIFKFKIVRRLINFYL